jgi:aryl-alcohol dehydrogenase-like predicted oxidoreductase
MPTEHFAALEPRLQRAESLAAFAEEQGHTLLELAISWLLCRRPVASVIAGATSRAQVEANATAGDWILDDAQLDAVDKLAPLPAG